jgi:hypothetical protein
VDNGFIVCFDWQGPQVDPVTITFEATVDEDTTCPATVTNTVYNQTDNPGSMVEMASVDVIVPNCVPTDVSMSDIGGQSNSASLIPLLVAMGAAALVAGALIIRRRKEA